MPVCAIRLFCVSWNGGVTVCAFLEYGIFFFFQNETECYISFTFWSFGEPQQITTTLNFKERTLYLRVFIFLYMCQQFGFNRKCITLNLITQLIRFSKICAISWRDALLNDIKIPKLRKLFIGYKIICVLLSIAATANH